MHLFFAEGQLNLLRNMLNMFCYSDQLSLYFPLFAPHFPLSFLFSRWFSLRLQTPPSVCGPSPGATVSRWCVPTRQVSLDCLCMLLGTTCSALLRIRYVCSFRKIKTDLRHLTNSETLIIRFLFCSTGPFLTSKLEESSPKSLMKALAVVSSSVFTCVFHKVDKTLIPGGNVPVCPPQLSPVLSSTLMVSSLVLEQLTLKSRSGIWRNAPTWPTSRATLAPSPQLLSLRTDTIWLQVTATSSIMISFVADFYRNFGGVFYFRVCRIPTTSNISISCLSFWPQVTVMLLPVF